VRARREQVAATGIAWVADEYAQGDRFTREQAMEVIEHELRKWKIQAERITEVLSNAATGFVASAASRPSAALRLLVDLGADVQRAHAIRAARPPRRVVAIRQCPDSVPPYHRRVSIDLVSRFDVDDRELSALHARAFGEDERKTPWRERLRRYALTWVGAFDGERLVGFVQVCWDGGAHAFLLDTAVDPPWQHRGIGRRLVEAAATDAVAAGCRWLHVDFEPDLAEFYLGPCGFTSTAAGLLRLDGPDTHAAPTSG